MVQKALAQSRFSSRIEKTVGEAGLAGPMTFNINVGGRRAAIEVKTTDSLAVIAQKINDAKDITIDPSTGQAYKTGLGVTASVVDNRLVIKSANTGLGNTTDVTSSPGDRHKGQAGIHRGQGRPVQRRSDR